MVAWERGLRHEQRQVTPRSVQVTLGIERICPGYLDCCGEGLPGVRGVCDGGSRPVAVADSTNNGTANSSPGDK